MSTLHRMRSCNSVRECFARTADGTGIIVSFACCIQQSPGILQSIDTVRTRQSLERTLEMNSPFIPMEVPLLDHAFTMPRSRTGQPFVTSVLPLLLSFR